MSSRAGFWIEVFCFPVELFSLHCHFGGGLTGQEFGQDEKLDHVLKQDVDKIFSSSSQSWISGWVQKYIPKLNIISSYIYLLEQQSSS